MAVNWNKQPYVTGLQLAEMPASEREWFLNQPNIWRLDRHTDVIWNLAHPYNRNRALNSLIDDAKRMPVLFHA